MKTHSLARNLILLANALKKLPNTEVDSLHEVFLPPEFGNISRKKVTQQELSSTLYTLAALNDIAKPQWIDLIDEFNFDVPIRQRDANRDIIGKLLKYLSVHPEARELLIGKKDKSKSVTASAKLADALSLLME